MNLSKENARENITTQMAEMLSEYKSSGSLPTDRMIAKLSCTFYERDKDRQIAYDVEMMAVVRGIDQGMKLMRQIIEG